MSIRTKARLDVLPARCFPRRLTSPERLWRALAWCVPRSLAYWCAIRVAADTLAGDQHPDDHTVPQMLQRWEERS